MEAVTFVGSGASSASAHVQGVRGEVGLQGRAIDSFWKLSISEQGIRGSGTKT